MFIPVSNYKKHIGYCLKIANNDKTGWLHSVYLKGYTYEGDRTYLLFEIIGSNDILYGSELKVDLSSIINYLYYDDGKDLDYYGEIDKDILESDLKSNELDENYLKWCEMMESVI